jgi:hypothetical protein
MGLPENAYAKRAGRGIQSNTAPRLSLRIVRLHHSQITPNIPHDHQR